MTEKQKHIFKSLATAAIASLEFADAVIKSSGGPGLDEDGRKFLGGNRLLLAELQRENPSIDIVYQILVAINPALENELRGNKFPPGGIVSEAEGGEYIVKKTESNLPEMSDGWIPNDIATEARVISREENEGLKTFSMPQMPGLKNAVNLQSRIDELVYLARKAGKTESDIMDCLSDILNPLSVEQRLNKLIG